MDGASAEIEAWCAQATEHEDDEHDAGTSVSASLVNDVAAFASSAIRSTDASAHAAAFLTLVTELYGGSTPPLFAQKPRARRQRAVLTAALVDALRAHATVRELLCAGWELALRSTTTDAARMQASLSAVIKLHLAATSEEPAQFWLGGFPSLVAVLRKLAEGGHEGAHVRKHIVCAVSALQAELFEGHGTDALFAPRIQPLVEVTKLLATRDSSAVVRQTALAALLQLEAPQAGSGTPLLALLRERALDKSAPVRSLALVALVEALDPALATATDLTLIIHRGIFEPDTPPKCKRACRSFLEKALTDSRRTESPADLLARTGMARALVDFKGQGGGFKGCALYEELFDEQLACAVFNAMDIMPPDPPACNHPSSMPPPPAGLQPDSRVPPTVEHANAVHAPSDASSSGSSM